MGKETPEVLVYTEETLTKFCTGIWVMEKNPQAPVCCDRHNILPFISSVRELNSSSEQGD